MTSYTDRDDLSDLAPISDKLLNDLSKLISSYNNLVAFDPELARRDEALLGPDARKKLVPPTDGQDVIRQAVALKAAVQNVFDTLEEEARVAPASPDPESRQSRRYSEGVKNFSRIAVERASEYAQTAWTHKGKVIVGASGTFAASKWVDANREWLLNFFSENEIMSQIIRRLLDLIDLLPLA
ncbi:MAG: hypothetical protein KF810_07755 [Rhizobiaceae bacterium]|nr:hypothetical protein [Rhizobiaceae bacterium]